MGLLQFRVLTLGLTSATGIFQYLMTIVMNEMDSFAMIYLDDILVFSETPERHFDHLRQMLGR